MKQQNLTRLNKLRQVLAAMGKDKPVEILTAEGKAESMPRRSSREMAMVSSKL